MSVWLVSGREIGASLVLACLNILVAMMLIGLGLLLALAVSVQTRCSRMTPSSLALRTVLATARNDRRNRA